MTNDRLEVKVEAIETSVTKLVEGMEPWLAW